MFLFLSVMLHIDITFSQIHSYATPEPCRLAQCVMACTHVRCQQQALIYKVSNIPNALEKSFFNHRKIMYITSQTSAIKWGPSDDVCAASTSFSM